LGLCLIGFAIDWSLILVIFEVAVALGMVIFVHELGHFVVAKLCGVKCEKFYLGFDIYGLKLLKFKRGETEYGIGILPLGGYVKMLGQEDNPAKLREEIERARQKPDAAAAAGGTGGLSASADAGTGGSTGGSPATAEAGTGGSTGGSPATAEAGTGGQANHATPDAPVDVAAAERALYDPRSYLAKSVPKRMAIISAGVIMNVIFAFICATIAYRLGVKQICAGIGKVVPGGPAWQVGLRDGDKIEEVGGKRAQRFQDVMTGISLGDNIAAGVTIEARRPDLKRPAVEEPVNVTVFPVNTGMKPTVGITSPFSTTLPTRRRPVIPGSAAARAGPEFQRGDTIVRMAIAHKSATGGRAERASATGGRANDIDAQPIETYAQVDAFLARHPDEPLLVTVERERAGAGQQPEAAPATETVNITVPTNPMRVLAPGLEMAMGKITAVQDDSPAKQAGLREGDVLRKIMGRPVGDPMSVPDRVRKLGNLFERIDLTIEREGVEKQIADVRLRQADWYEQPILEGSPMSIPQLGIAYQVLNRVAEVTKDSLAAEAGLQEGDVIVAAILLPPEKETDGDEKIDQEEVALKFDDENPNWPFLMHVVQASYPGSRVELKLEDGRKGRKIVLEPAPARAWFNPDRGFLFDPEEFTETAGDWGDALRLGARETWESLTLVVVILRKIGTQISARALGGPGTIAVVAGHAAYEGLSALLIFITIISANLAVLNFLPIPLLDGGHMMLLAWEGVRGKPADERVQAVLTYIGLCFILGLMAWVIGLDIVRFVFKPNW